MAEQQSHHEEEQLGKLYDAKAARRLLRYIAPYKRLVVIALSLTFGLNLVRQVGPLLTKWTIDDYIKPAADGSMQPTTAIDGIFLLAVAHLISLVVSLAVGYFQDVMLNTIG